MPENNKKSFVSKARQDLFEMYMDALKVDKIPWRQPWTAIGEPRNALTKTKYRGLNAWFLKYVQEKRNIEDGRWATFKQITDEKGTYHPGQRWHLKRGSQGVHIEYWQVRNIRTNQLIDLSEYRRIVQANPDKAAEYRWWCRNATVFNLTDVEGAPELAKKKCKATPLEDIQAFCEEANRNMGVTVYHSGDKAFYRPSHDTITLPEMEAFDTPEGYYSTRLHETAHSTGASSRLNRNLANWFGSDEYAKEELRAEIASSLLCADLRLESREYVIDNHSDNPISVNSDGSLNHAAYVQSWIEQLENNPDVLFEAFKDAENIAAYVEGKANVSFKAIQDTFEDDYSEEIIKCIRYDFEQEVVSQDEYYALIEKKDWLQDTIKEATKGGYDLTVDVVATEYAVAREKLLIGLGYRMDKAELEYGPSLEDGFFLDR